MNAAWWWRLLFRLGFSVPAEVIFPDIQSRKIIFDVCGYCGRPWKTCKKKPCEKRKENSDDREA